MSERKKAAAPAPSRGSKLTLSVGLVNVPVKIAPFARSTAVSGKRVCPCHHEPVVSETQCAVDGGAVEAETGFEHEGRIVTGVDREQFKGERDGTLALTGLADVASFDPVYFEKTYLLWPQAGGEAAHDLVAHALRASGKALVGQTVLSSSTRAIAIRWSDATSCLVAHVLSYDEAIAWADAQLVSDAIEGRPEPDAAQLGMAEQLLATLPEQDGDDAIDGVKDEYANGLRAAIAAAADGLPAPKVAPAAPVAEVGDLMEALKASIEQTPKPKAKAKSKTKAAA